MYAEESNLQLEWIENTESFSDVDNYTNMTYLKVQYVIFGYVAVKKQNCMHYAGEH